MTQHKKAKIAAGVLLALTTLLVLILNISFVCVAVLEWKVVTSIAVSVFFACTIAGLMLGVIFAAICVKPLDFNKLEESKNEDHQQVP
jgi:hypothetical protein